LNDNWRKTLRLSPCKFIRVEYSQDVMFSKEIKLVNIDLAYLSFIVSLFWCSKVWTNDLRNNLLVINLSNIPMALCTLLLLSSVICKKGCCQIINTTKLICLNTVSENMLKSNQQLKKINEMFSFVNIWNVSF